MGVTAWGFEGTEAGQSMDFSDFGSGGTSCHTEAGFPPNLSTGYGFLSRSGLLVPVGPALNDQRRAAIPYPFE
jgi:hypothetical protein